MFNKRVVSVLCVLICQHIVEHIYRMLKERKYILHNHNVLSFTKILDVLTTIIFVGFVTATRANVHSL